MTSTIRRLMLGAALTGGAILGALAIEQAAHAADKPRPTVQGALDRVSGHDLPDRIPGVKHIDPRPDKPREEPEPEPVRDETPRNPRQDDEQEPADKPEPEPEPKDEPEPAPKDEPEPPANERPATPADPIVEVPPLDPPPLVVDVPPVVVDPPPVVVDVPPVAAPTVPAPAPTEPTPAPAPVEPTPTTPPSVPAPSPPSASPPTTTPPPPAKPAPPATIPVVDLPVPLPVVIGPIPAADPPSAIAAPPSVAEGDDLEVTPCAGKQRTEPADHGRGVVRTITDKSSGLTDATPMGGGCPRPATPAGELAQPALKPPGSTGLDVASSPVGLPIDHPSGDQLRALWPRDHLPAGRAARIDPRPA
ncbi:hypothetical protein [Micromonospora sp. NPDC023633]|uniref:hypothetical protein n=1 Tax=Micromonospora sp. NPDC023633 TaxID=3154320 RepID=UPI0033F90F18